MIESQALLHVRQRLLKCCPPLSNQANAVQLRKKKNIPFHSCLLLVFIFYPLRVLKKARNNRLPLTIAAPTARYWIKTVL
jgi:hypothetical protein